MTDLADKQDDIIDKMQAQLIEFAQQTHELKSQTFLVSEGNKLLGEQVKVLSSHFEFYRDMSLSKVELEKRDRLRKNMPKFESFSGFFEENNANLDFTNSAALAKAVDIELISSRIPLSLYYSDSEIETVKNNESFRVKLVAVFESSSYRIYPFSFYINFEDIDGNKYHQLVSCKNESWIDITEPRIIQSE